MDAAPPLTPAESLVLLQLNGAGTESVKVTLLSLLAQRTIRIEQRSHKRLIGSKMMAHVLIQREAGAAVPAHVASLLELIRTEGADGAEMTRLVKRARHEYGPGFRNFNDHFILPRLQGLGLIEVFHKRVLGILNTHGFKHTPAGEAARDALQERVAQARRLPALLDSNPSEAAALALGLGSALLLATELKPHYKQLAAAMRAQDQTGFNDPSGLLDLASDGIDFSSLDADAFSTLDSGMDAFDSSFDSAAGDSGGDGGGSDGGGGDSGGG